MVSYPHERKPAPKGPVEPYPIETKSLRILMKEYLRERDLSYLVATKTNAWYPTKALDSVPRIVVPASNLEGSRFWQARAMVPTPFRWMSAKGSKAGSIVVVWPEEIKTTMKMVVVEGPMDALAAATTGHLGLAAMGKINLKDVIDYIRRGFRFVVDSTGMIIIVPDMDSPDFGAKAAKELALSGIRSEVRMPDFEDLAAMKKKQRVLLLG